MGYLKNTTASAVVTSEMVTGPCEVAAVGLLAGSDAATAVFRDGSATGPIVWALGAGTGLSAPPGIFDSCIRVKTSLWVVLTGTAPLAMATIQNPAPNQITP